MAGYLGPDRLRLPSNDGDVTSAADGDMWVDTNAGIVKLQYSGAAVPLGTAFPDANLKFYYKLHGNVSDETSNTTMTASGVTYTSGPSGAANTAMIVGSGDSCSVPITVASGQKTMAFWIKTSYNSNVDAFRLGWAGNSNGNGFMFMHGVGSIQDLGFWGYGSGYDYAVGATSYTQIIISDGQWHHVVAVWDGSTSHAYIDGVKQTQYYNGATNSNMNLNTTGGWTSFVLQNATVDVHLSGIAYWDRVLSSNEVNAVMNITGA